jgi:hypothetical protein
MLAQKPIEMAHFLDSLRAAGVPDEPQPPHNSKQ